jgi:hypothetical protein
LIDKFIIPQVLDMHDDMKTLISQPVGPITMSGDEDFEKELEELLAEPHGESGGGDGGGTESEMSFSGKYLTPQNNLAKLFSICIVCLAPYCKIL